MYNLNYEDFLNDPQIQKLNKYMEEAELGKED